MSEHRNYYLCAVWDGDSFSNIYIAIDEREADAFALGYSLALQHRKLAPFVVVGNLSGGMFPQPRHTTPSLATSWGLDKFHEIRRRELARYEQAIAAASEEGNHEEQKEDSSD